MKILYHINEHRRYPIFWQNVPKIFEFTTCFDRTNTIDFGFDYETHSPIPVISQHPSYTFEQVADIRGQQLSQKDNVLLFLSGGIDSTVAFCALLKTGVPFSVTYDRASMAEYPALYDRLFAGEWPQISLVSLRDLTPDTVEKYHTVNGSIGDQVSLPVTALNLDGTGFKEKLLEPYTKVMPSYLLDKLEEQMSKSQVAINDLADFLWWVDFTLKHQATLIGSSLKTGANICNPNSYSVFYDSVEMDVWSMLSRDENKECIRLNDIGVHKKPFKEYIYNVLSDLDYFKNKRKVPSLPRRSPNS